MLALGFEVAELEFGGALECGGHEGGSGRVRNQSAVRKAPRINAKTIPVTNVAGDTTLVWHMFMASVEKGTALFKRDRR